MKIGIIAGGKLGQLAVIDIIENKTEFTEIVIFDDHVANNKIKTFAFEDFKKVDFKEWGFFVALGYKHLITKTEIINWIKNNNRILLTLKSNKSFIHSTAQIENGVYIFPLTNIDQNVKIESGCVIHNSSIICHNSIIGESTYISPGVTICGDVIIGKNVFIGAGSIISNGVKIGDHCIVGIASVVTRDLPCGVSFIGNPGRIMNKKLKIN